MSDERSGPLRRALRRMTTAEEELHAEELRDDVARDLHSTPIEDCGDRDHVTIGGQIRSVTLRPVGGVPALEAELFDGSGSVTLVFLGRRQVGGIEPGRVVVAEGRLRRDEGRCLMFNPRYDLRPATGQ